MSLDIYLYGEEVEERCECRECGNIHTRAVREELFWGNITHNLNRMADKAGIYHAMWRPDEIGIFKAGDLIMPLEAGLEILKADPDGFRELNPENGWGSYEGLVQFVSNLAAACREHPNANVVAS